MGRRTTYQLECEVFSGTLSIDSTLKISMNFITVKLTETHRTGGFLRLSISYLITQTIRGMSGVHFRQKTNRLNQVGLYSVALSGNRCYHRQQIPVLKIKLRKCGSDI